MNSSSHIPHFHHYCHYYHLIGYVVEQDSPPAATGPSATVSGTFGGVRPRGPSTSSVASSVYVDANNGSEHGDTHAANDYLRTSRTTSVASIDSSKSSAKHSSVPPLSSVSNNPFSSEDGGDDDEWEPTPVPLPTHHAVQTQSSQQLQQSQSIRSPFPSLSSVRLPISLSTPAPTPTPTPLKSAPALQSLQTGRYSNIIISPTPSSSTANNLSTTHHNTSNDSSGSSSGKVGTSPNTDDSNAEIRRPSVSASERVRDLRKELGLTSTSSTSSMSSSSPSLKMGEVFSGLKSFLSMKSTNS